MNQEDHSRQGDSAAAENATTEPCCTPVSLDLEPSAVEDHAAVLDAMGNETRYAVLRLLEGARDPVCACDLTPALGVNQSTTSRALKRLYRAGLVDRRKDGRWRYYSLTDRAKTLLRALDDVGDHR